MANKKIILENTHGQTVRTFNDMPTSFDLVLRLDTGRIMAVSFCKELDNEMVPYRKLARIKTSDLTNSGQKIEGYGTVRALTEVRKYSESLKLKPESNRKYNSFLTLSTIGHLSLVLFILSIGFFFNPEKEIEPTEVVIIKPKKKIRPLVKKQTVKVSKRKVTKKVKKRRTKKTVKRKSSRVQNLVKRPKRTRKKTGRQAVALNQRGALAALGAISAKSRQNGGVNIKNVKTSLGAGLGGSGGSGGVQTSIYSKGLVSAPTGRGGKIQGAGGYGTKGKGGGKAGYGRMALSGGSTAYFKPLTAQAFVQGGLDKSQVAAVINRHLGQVRYCYEKGLQSKPHLKGRLKMKFTINGNGIVSAANVGSSSVNDQTVESCITKKLRSWKFPKPVGNVNVKVSYPFVLNRVSKG